MSRRYSYTNITSEDLEIIIFNEVVTQKSSVIDQAKSHFKLFDLEQVDYNPKLNRT